VLGVCVLEGVDIGVILGEGVGLGGGVKDIVDAGVGARSGEVVRARVTRVKVRISARLRAAVSARNRVRARLRLALVSRLALG
jgi:hypothetical protein